MKWEGIAIEPSKIQFEKLSKNRNCKVLNEAINGNIEPFNKFLEVLNKPYLEQKDIKNYQIPISSNEKYQTFCGT